MGQLLGFSRKHNNTPPTQHCTQMSSRAHEELFIRHYLSQRGTMGRFGVMEPTELETEAREKWRNIEAKGTLVGKTPGQVVNYAKRTGVLAKAYVARATRRRETLRDANVDAFTEGGRSAIVLDLGDRVLLVDGREIPLCDVQIAGHRIGWDALIAMVSNMRKIAKVLERSGAAVDFKALGRAGGKARLKKISKARRSRIARQAAKVRWSKQSVG